MPLQPKFNRFSTAAEIQATFNFSDIQSGIGVTDYILFVSEDSSGKQLGLTTRTLRSSDITSQNLKSGSKDFDLTQFQITQTISGTAIITGTYRYTPDGINTGRFQIEIIHVDGITSTETVIGTKESATESSANNTNYNYQIPLTEKVFNPGDILRVSITYREISSGGGAAPNFTFGTDPSNRDKSPFSPSSADETTITKISIPQQLFL